MSADPTGGSQENQPTGSYKTVVSGLALHSVAVQLVDLRSVGGYGMEEAVVHDWGASQALPIGARLTCQNQQERGTGWFH